MGPISKRCTPISAQQHLFWNVHGEEVGSLGNSRRRPRCAYRGELLGLLAIHLILLAVNKLSPSLSGSTQIYSDCLGALHNVEHLPPHRIPSSCRHSDILKKL
mmetsp:Transcript_35773/g.73112  ORF Transcript_35773/g.73112 Transcript_35773/m.73112 type:complete len:103 (-) Transcript_35773:1065-1373(-)